jgi:hypothetical protein
MHKKVFTPENAAMLLIDHQVGTMAWTHSHDINVVKQNALKLARIGKAAVMPGDVVLARDGGVMFIPPQLAEQVVRQSERTRLRDTFGHQRLNEKKYTAGQIDREWTPEIEADYTGWLKENMDKLPVPRPQIQEILDERAKRAKR